MIQAGLPLRCVSVSAPGAYDTHNAQAASLASGLSGTSATLLNFQRDLESRGVADRVVTLVWSEFGRRPQENGSQGTDHGAGGIAFLLGTQVLGQQAGEYPGIASLDNNGNLKATVDFRAVYCSLLEQWVGVDAASIIPGAASFSRPGLIK